MFPPPHKHMQGMSVWFLTITDAEIDWDKQQELQVPPLAQ